MRRTPLVLLLLWALPAQLFAQRVPREQRYGELPYTRTHFAMPRYPSLEAWEARRAALREQILVAAGLFPLPDRARLKVRRFGRVERPSYSVEKVTIEPLPGYVLAGNLYLPLTPGPHPSVLVPHGHWEHGRVEDIPTYSVPALGANLAHQGYVAFAYDMVGYNDTRQTPHDFGGSPQEESWSFGPLGLQLWNSMRALDFLESLPEVDRSRLAVTGASGGATQTFLLAAVDDRIRVSIPVNMVSGVMQGGSPCENAPGLRIATSNIEIAALAAPRPMLLISTTRDWTRNTPKEEYPQIRSIYELYGNPGNLEFVQSRAEHNYDRDSREAAYEFLRKHLLGGGGESVRETIEHGLAPGDLLIGEPAIPPNALSFEGLYASWQQQSERQAAAASRAELRRRINLTTGARWPEQVGFNKSGSRLLLRRAGTDDQVRARWWQGRTDETVVIVHPEGTEAASHSDAAVEGRRRGASVLLVNVFGVRTNEAARYRGGRHFHTFNRSLDALRVQDVVTAAAFAKGRTNGRVTVVGLASAAAWVLLAAVAIPDAAGIELSFSGADVTREDTPHIPGLRRAGALEAAVRTLGLAPPARSAVRVPVRSSIGPLHELAR